MGKEDESKKLEETEANLELLDMGDAIAETKQTVPFPRYPDSAVGGWGFHPD